MARIDRNVLRIALYELRVSGDAPAGVVIDEAVELAKQFGSEASRSSSTVCSRPPSAVASSRPPRVSSYGRQIVPAGKSVSQMLSVQVFRLRFVVVASCSVFPCMWLSLKCCSGRPATSDAVTDVESAVVGDDEDFCRVPHVDTVTNCFPQCDFRRPCCDSSG